MKTRHNRFLLLAFLLIGMGASGADDKNITIDGELAASAEVLKVKLGASWNGMWKFKFGDYAVETSKMGPAVTTSEYAGLGATTRDRMKSEFSFVLGNKTSGSAEVNTAFKGVTATKTSTHLPDIILDRDEVLRHTYEFVAKITTSDDDEEAWYLALDYAEGTKVAAQNEGLLSNRNRSFSIVPASSATGGKDSRTFPALGYEFIEDGVSRGAVQYFGGGVFGANKCIIWLGADLDPEMKLVLAATMAAILQVKIRVD